MNNVANVVKNPFVSSHDELESNFFVKWDWESPLAQQAYFVCLDYPHSRRCRIPLGKLFQKANGHWVAEPEPHLELPTPWSEPVFVHRAKIRAMQWIEELSVGLFDPDWEDDAFPLPVVDTQGKVVRYLDSTGYESHAYLTTNEVLETIKYINLRKALSDIGADSSLDAIRTHIDSPGFVAPVVEILRCLYENGIVEMKSQTSGKIDNDDLQFNALIDALWACDLVEPIPGAPSLPLIFTLNPKHASRVLTILENPSTAKPWDDTMSQRLEWIVSIDA